MDKVKIVTTIPWSRTHAKVTPKLDNIISSDYYPIGHWSKLYASGKLPDGRHHHA
jgi:hypothetical protein